VEFEVISDTAGPWKSIS